MPKPTTEGSVRSQLEFMSYQIHERLLQLGQPEDAGVLESVLKTVGKVTDQAFDSAVLYVDSAVSSPSERSERSPSRASVVEKAESKTSVRERLRLRKQRSRMSVLSPSAAWWSRDVPRSRERRVKSRRPLAVCKSCLWQVPCAGMGSQVV